MMEKKNVLFILQALPWPLEFGGKQAMFNGIYAVKDVANIFVTYLQYNEDTEERQREQFVNKLGGNVTVLPYIEKRDMSTPRKVVGKVADYFDKYVFKEDRDFLLKRELEIRQPSQAQILFINEVIRTYHIDIVQVEMLTNVAIVNSLPQNLKKIFVHHELGYIRKAQLLEEVNANDYWHSVAESMKVLEIGLINKYDDVVVLSNADKLKLESAGVNRPIHTSFAIVRQIEMFNPVIDDYHTLFYIGPSKHRPNYFAIKWFLDNCWDKLLEKDSKFKLKIIGKWDDESKSSLSEKSVNVEFSGFVENLVDVIKNGIMIVPITIGSGIRMKILEAAALGVPIVSTTVGAEGLPIKNGDNGFLADDPDCFVKDILALSDKNLRLKFVRNLHSIISSHYSIEALKNNRRTILGL